MSSHPNDRVEAALDILIRYGQTDGDHHKLWVIDQAVRCLTGCPREDKTSIDYKGKGYNYSALGESEEYKKLIAESCDGEDGPQTYSWDIGVAP